ncbi:MAG: hypothetical protein R3F20_06680 [Planctomycetota bacterium]
MAIFAFLALGLLGAEWYFVGGRMLMDLDLLRPGFLVLVFLLPLLFFFPRRAEGAALIVSAIGGIPCCGRSRPPRAHPRAGLAGRDREEGATHRVVLVDRSAAVDDVAASRSLAAAVRLAEEGLGRRALAPRRSRHGGRRRAAAPEGFTTVRTLDADRGAPLGAGLTAALALIPEGSGGTVTYLGRGAALDRDWAAAALEAGARGVAIDTWSEDEPLVAPRAVALEAMDELRVGHETVLRLAVEGPAARLRVVLEEDGEAVVESEWIDVPAPRAEIDLRFAPAAGRLRPLRRATGGGRRRGRARSRASSRSRIRSASSLGARMTGGDAGPAGASVPDSASRPRARRKSTPRGSASTTSSPSMIVRPPP